MMLKKTLIDSKKIWKKLKMMVKKKRKSYKIKANKMVINMKKI